MAVELLKHQYFSDQDKTRRSAVAYCIYLPGDKGSEINQTQITCTELICTTPVMYLNE
jgi:hypothetical protein